MNLKVSEVENKIDIDEELRQIVEEASTYDLNKIIEKNDLNLLKSYQKISDRLAKLLHPKIKIKGIYLSFDYRFSKESREEIIHETNCRLHKSLCTFSKRSDLDYSNKVEIREKFSLLYMSIMKNVKVNFQRILYQTYVFGY